jgi:hypothetical protein
MTQMKLSLMELILRIRAMWICTQRLSSKKEKVFKNLTKKRKIRRALWMIQMKIEGRLLMKFQDRSL